MRRLLSTICLLFSLLPVIGVRETEIAPTYPRASLTREIWAKTANFDKLTTNVQVSAPPKPVDTVKFSELAPIRQQQTAQELWGEMEQRLSRGEFQQIPILANQLADSLRQEAAPEVYETIAETLNRTNIPLETKAILLDLLAETATPESLTQLLDLTDQNLDNSLYILVMQAISRIGDNHWDGRFHEELSPLLEAAWNTTDSSDPAFLSALSKAIATIGSPQGVAQLLISITGNENTKSSSEIEESIERSKQEAAFTAIPQVSNPAAIEVLGTSLKQEPLGTPAFEASGEALAQMGSSTATEKIIDWAKDAPSEGARNLEDWLTQTDDENLANSLATSQNTSFKSPEIADVVQSAKLNKDPATTFAATNTSSETDTASFKSINTMDLK